MDQLDSMSKTDYTLSLGLSIAILTFTFIGFLISFGVLLLIFIHRRQHPINATTLLLCNTYLAMALSCISLLDMYAHKFYRSKATFNNGWCHVRAYLLHVGLCSIYHSYLLQTSFRFFRIVFHQHKSLQEYRFILKIIIFQWLISFLSMLVIVQLRHFQYIPIYSHCQIPFTDLRGLLISAWIVYYFPMLAIAAMYLYIVYFINESCNARIRRNRRRDVFVFRRILCLIVLLVIFCLPAILMWAVYMITGYLYRLIYHFQWFTFALSMALLPIVSALITTHVKRLLQSQWTQRLNVHPIVVSHRSLHRTNQNPKKRTR